MTRSRVSLVVIAAVGLGACLRLDGFIYRPKPVADADLGTDLMAKSDVPADLREEIKDAIKAPDGTVVNAWVVRHKAGDGTPESRHSQGIVYCHGNNTHIGTTGPRIDALWKLGYNVIVFDPRGFGKTRGTQTETGVYSDAAATRAYFEGRTDLGLSADRVGLYGRSLGTALCTHLAVERAPKALVLESPISAIQTIIDDSTGIDTPVEWYVDTKMDNPEVIKNLTSALLIMHGAEDDYVQPKYGEELFANATKAAEPKTFWLVPGADHGTVPCKEFGPSEIDNGCAGGFNPEYNDKVTGFYDATIGK